MAVAGGDSTEAAAGWEAGRGPTQVWQDGGEAERSPDHTAGLVGRGRMRLQAVATVEEALCLGTHRSERMIQESAKKVYAKEVSNYGEDLLVGRPAFALVAPALHLAEVEMDMT